MNLKKALAFFAFACLFSLSVFAATPNQSSKHLTYSGQNSEELALETVRTITRYRSEVVDSTCTRQIPYTVNECGYETRYRNECHWRAGENVCSTDYERICRNVTRYRRQCTNSGTRRVCRREAPTQRCRTRNGQRRCVDIPGREVCRQEPGRQVCRQVPYNDRECRNEPRRRCDWVPGRNVCRNVSYQEYICKDVTKYRDEQYACKKTIQVPYQVTQKVEASVSLNFVDHYNVEKLGMNISLKPNGKVKLNITEDLNNLPFYVKVIKRHETDDNDDSVQSTTHFNLEFIGKNQRDLPVSKGITELYISSDGGIYFRAGKATFADQTEVFVKIRRWSKDRLVKTISLSDVEVREENGDTALYRINVKALGASPKKGKNYQVTVKLTQKHDSLIINPRTNLASPEKYRKMKAN